MAWHARHVFRPPGEARAQIRFRRTDLLYRHDGVLRDPHAEAKRRAARARDIDPDRLILEVPGLPLSAPTGFVVGPTLLDMLLRSVWLVSDLPEDTQKALRAQLDPDESPPTSVAAWSARNLDTLWPAPGQAQRPPREAGEESRAPDHPFLAGLASGGTPLAEAPPSDEWLPVTKLSTCLIGEYIYRVAAGIYGGVDDAYTQIAEAATKAWSADLERALTLWNRIRAAPGGVLIEDRTVAALRPVSSINQEIERTIMREVCQWLGVDPELDVRRARGRPRTADRNADQGDIIRVVLAPDGTVTGTFLVDFEGVRAGTELHALPLPTIVAVLGALRLRGLEADTALLEAWLDAAVPDWRERVVDEDLNAAPSSSTPDPFEVLGVAHDAPMEEITRAFRTAMKAVHPDTSGGASTWLSRTVIHAYKTIRTARAAGAT